MSIKFIYSNVTYNNYDIVILYYSKNICFPFYIPANDGTFTPESCTNFIRAPRASDSPECKYSIERKGWRYEKVN